MNLLFFTLLLFLLIFSGTDSATAEVWYASPEGKVGWWKGERKAADGALAELIKRANKQRGTPIEIRLLTDNDRGRVTAYRGRIVHQGRTFERGPTEITGFRSSSAPLTIKGQVENGVWLTRFAGPSLRDTVCDRTILEYKYWQRCLKAEAAPPGDAPRPVLSPPDLLDVVAGELGSLELLKGETLSEKIRLLSPAVQHLRLNCIVLEKTSHVELVDLGFRDCWLPGVYILDSRYITVRHSKFEGSSFAIAAVARNSKPELVGHILLRDNSFIQSPKMYQEPQGCGDPRRDLTCGVDIWAEIPWGVTHHGIWGPLNGGFFGAMDIGGPITLLRNEVKYAYNGVRMKISRDCKKSQHCRKKANTDVVIHDNFFGFIRDNPIEPEGQADRWVVSHNRFFNSHAWISMDGVAGGRIYVFGNRGWYNELPSLHCEDTGWEDSPQFYFKEKAQGEYRIPDDLDPNCHTHDWGTVFKTNFAKDGVEKPFLKGVYIFNNSWMVRSPFIRRGRISPMHHWNNAILFHGCGGLGPSLCRTRPSRARVCADMPRHLTPDRKAYWADCFDFFTKDGRFPHEFDYDAVTKGFPAVFEKGPKNPKQERHGLVVTPEEMFQSPDEGIFDPPDNSPLKGKGCVVDFDDEGEDVTCTINGEDRPYIGAVQADGKLFRIDLPWRPDFWRDLYSR